MDGRYSIAAYTVSSAGVYYLTNTSVSVGGQCGSGLALRVYVNSLLVKTQNFAAGQTAVFNTLLGTLNSGDVVYVAAAAAAAGSCTVTFNWDFALEMYPGNNKAATLAASMVMSANTLVATNPRYCEPTDVGAVYSVGGNLQVTCLPLFFFFRGSIMAAWHTLLVGCLKSTSILF